MNEQLEKFARETLKKGLSRCNPKMQTLFKRMYSHGNLDLNINEVVDSMPVEKLDWAMDQVQKTIEKYSLQETNNEP